MNWNNVRLIFQREVRDQLRDRRTVFTIAVLPLLLYPLLGMTFLQIAQFMRQHPTRILVIGAESLPEQPQLLADGSFHEELFLTDEAAHLLEMERSDESIAGKSPAELLETAQQKIDDEEVDAVVIFPPDFDDRVEQFRRRTEHGREDTAEIPKPQIYYNAAKDKSRIAYDRVADVIDRWREKVVERNLEESSVPKTVTRPFEVIHTDVAEDEGKRAAIWSKILPFVALIWALTGAFYPAIDLCAGEKERGTLETLLSSPAGRNEIVWGKLFTVTLFSMATAVLNLISMGVTGLFIIRQMGDSGFGLGPPPLMAIVWLLLALPMICALFSALALAIAAFAKSTKEGQYYLMPLLMITLPLMMLPLLPAAELDLGASLIPVSGMMLLLRQLIEGEYMDAAIHAGPVLGVTGLCCWLAIRWAVDQFNNESVLFRESEQWGLGLWLRHLVRDREDTPTFGEAVLCGVVLLLLRFFANFLAPTTAEFSDIAVSTAVVQIALIATPALMMTIFLTRSAKKTLLLRWPSWSALAIAPLLAVVLHPSVVHLGEAIQRLYPFSEETLQQLMPFHEMMAEAPLLYVILLFAVLPAICEELAFRGFILSGLRHMGHRWAAIVISSLFFGATHGILQQSLGAAVVGVIIGYIAIQTGSLLPCMLFHMVHNSLAMLLARLTPEVLETQPWLHYLFHASESEGVLEISYRWPVVAVGAVLAVALLWWLRGFERQQYAEERLQEALDNQSSNRTISKHGVMPRSVT